MRRFLLACAFLLLPSAVTAQEPPRLEYPAVEAEAFEVNAKLVDAYKLWLENGASEHVPGGVCVVGHVNPKTKNPVFEDVIPSDDSRKCSEEEGVLALLMFVSRVGPSADDMLVQACRRLGWVRRDYENIVAFGFLYSLSVVHHPERGLFQTPRVSACVLREDLFEREAVWR